MIAVLLIVSYLLGSISTGYIIAKAGKGIDIREHGSGNVGTTNILRTMGVLPAILVLLLDMLKGMAAVYLARWLLGTPEALMLSGIMAVIGHNWPVFHGFRGGKGIATSMGVILALNPLILFIITAVGILIVLLTKFVSLASLVGALLFPVLLYKYGIKGIEGADYLSVIFSIVITLLAIARHKENIKRLAGGKENKIGKN